jgi:nucleoside diphosphate kinase
VDTTFLMVKPEAVRNGKQGEIIDLVIKNRFRIVRMKLFKFDQETARAFYAVHEGKHFFADLIAYITSGEVIGIALEKEGAVELLRELARVRSGTCTEPTFSAMPFMLPIRGNPRKKSLPSFSLQNNIIGS